MAKSVLWRFARRVGIQRRVNWYLTKLNYSTTTYVNGVTMSIPSIRGISCIPSEPWMVELLDCILPEQPGVFVDVGVNVGQTLIKVKAVDPPREYIGFEPNPVCNFYLQELIKTNDFKNCTIFPVGLFTKNCVLSLDLFSNDPTDSSASLVNNFRSEKKAQSKIFVPAFRFDSLDAHIQDIRVGVIKIDVEGAELEVVKSLSDLIKRNRPIIIIELLPVYSVENDFRKKRQDELEKIFADENYAIFRVKKTGEGKYGGLVRINKIGIHSDLTQCDYVVMPKDKISKLKVAKESSSNRVVSG